MIGSLHRAGGIHDPSPRKRIWERITRSIHFILLTSLAMLLNGCGDWEEAKIRNVSSAD